MPALPVPVKARTQPPGQTPGLSRVLPLFRQLDAMRLCSCATCAVAFAALIEASRNGSRSVEAVESTNAHALNTVINVAQAAAVKRLGQTVRVFM